MWTQETHGGRVRVCERAVKKSYLRVCLQCRGRTLGLSESSVTLSGQQLLSHTHTHTHTHRGDQIFIIKEARGQDVNLYTCPFPLIALLYPLSPSLCPSLCPSSLSYPSAKITRWGKHQRHRPMSFIRAALSLLESQSVEASQDKPAQSSSNTDTQVSTEVRGVVTCTRVSGDRRFTKLWQVWKSTRPLMNCNSKWYISMILAAQCWSVTLLIFLVIYKTNF